MVDLAFPGSPTNGDTYPNPPIAGVPVWKFDGAKWKIIAGNASNTEPHDGLTYGRKNNEWQEAISILNVGTQKVAFLPTVVMPFDGHLVFNSVFESGEWRYLANGPAGVIVASNDQACVFIHAVPGTAGTPIAWGQMARIDLDGSFHSSGRIVVGGNGLNTPQMGGNNTFLFHRWDVNDTCYTMVDGDANWRPITNWTSDERFKQDIAPSSLDCVSVIERIPLYQFHWKSSSVKDLQPVGLVAQRLKEVASFLVNDSPPLPKDGAMKSLEIDANSVLAVLIGAIQELTTRIEILKAKHGIDLSSSSKHQ